MKINRVWAMPNKWTFKVKPIAELVERYVGDGIGWADPFAGESNLVQFRNDLKTKQPYQMDAIDFLKQLKDNTLTGILLDPPYSLRQIFKTYNNRGKNSLLGAFVPMTLINNIVARKVKIGGMVISFGWSSNGIGKKRGFEIEEILLVAHGGHHNDTIITVEKKKQITF